LEVLNNICTNFSDQNLKLENFITQNQTSFNNLNNQLKKIQHDLLQLKNNIEKTFKEIEMETNGNQNFLAKWISGANTRLARKQIYQKQIGLTNQVQKINDTFGQITQEIENTVNNFMTSSQQIIANYKNTENQLQTAFKTNQTTSAASPTNANTQLQLSIKQAIDALNVARKGIEQQKIFSEINKSIDNLLQ